MTTKELIKKLHELDPDGEDEVYFLDEQGVGLKVRIAGRSGWYDPYKDQRFAQQVVIS